MSETEETGDGGGGGGKMLLIIGLVGGLAIGGGGAFFLLGGQTPPPAEGEAKKEEEPKTVVPDTLHTVTFERVAVPIYGERNGRKRFEGNFFVDIAINTVKESDVIKVRLSEARLRHAIIDAISKPGLMREDSPTQVDTEKAKTVFLQRAREIVGEDVVYDLSITNVVRVSG